MPRNSRRREPVDDPDALASMRPWRNAKEFRYCRHPHCRQHCLASMRPWRNAKEFYPNTVDVGLYIRASMRPWRNAKEFTYQIYKSSVSNAERFNEALA